MRYTELAADRSKQRTAGVEGFWPFEVLICADRIWPECLNQDIYIWPLQLVRAVIRCVV